MYLDKELTYNFDDLLDKGYNMVSNKKQDRDSYIEQVIKSHIFKRNNR